MPKTKYDDIKDDTLRTLLLSLEETKSWTETGDEYKQLRDHSWFKSNERMRALYWKFWGEKAAQTQLRRRVNRYVALLGRDFGSNMNRAHLARAIDTAKSLTTKQEEYIVWRKEVSEVLYNAQEIQEG